MKEVTNKEIELAAIQLVETPINFIKEPSQEAIDAVVEICKNFNEQ